MNGGFLQITKCSPKHQLKGQCTTNEDLYGDFSEVKMKVTDHRFSAAGHNLHQNFSQEAAAKYMTLEKNEHENALDGEPNQKHKSHRHHDDDQPGSK